MTEIDRRGWTVDHTNTRESDLRIIAGHYPFAIRDQIGDMLALVKSRSEARLGFAKASTLDERDEGWKIATLMAAAPDLLAVVERLIDIVDDYPLIPSREERDGVTADAHEALRKARG